MWSVTCCLYPQWYALQILDSKLEFPRWQSLARHTTRLSLGLQGPPKSEFLSSLLYLSSEVRPIFSGPCLDNGPDFWCF